jgi:inner membrane protein
MKSSISTPESRLKNSVLLRMLLVAVLGMMLVIPTFMVQVLIDERQTARDTAVQDITAKWGGAQLVSGPVLSVPVVHTQRTAQGSITTTRSLLHLLPEQLHMQVRLVPEVRARGLYRAVLYQAQMSLEADFQVPDTAKVARSGETVAWADAFLTLGVADLTGIKKVEAVRWNAQPLSAEAGVNTAELAGSGFTAYPAVLPGEKAHLSATLTLNGSELFQVLPAGRETRLTVEGGWDAPSFTGAFLPDERVVSSTGFRAQWQVGHLNRSFPQSWRDGQAKLDPTSAFGVRLLLPVDEYQKNTRAAKYAILFIALTFLAFFVTEVLTRTPFHPIHYALISFGLVLFFVLLLSLSEHMQFNQAYLAAATAVVGLVGGYTRSISGSTRIALAITGLLVLLYSFLFVLLQLEDYALLVGSLGLFALLALVMYLTRRIDWFNLGGGGTRETPAEA